MYPLGNLYCYDEVSYCSSNDFNQHQIISTPLMINSKNNIAVFTVTCCLAVLLQLNLTSGLIAQQKQTESKKSSLKNDSMIKTDSSQDELKENPGVRPLPESITAQVNERDWWLPRHEEKLARKSKMEKVDIVMLGDSITHGWEKKGKSVFKKRFKGLQVLNLGYSSDRTEHVLWRLRNGEVEGISPKVVMLMIGTNNTGHRKETHQKRQRWALKRSLRNYESNCRKQKFSCRQSFHGINHQRGKSENKMTRSIRSSRTLQITSLFFTPTSAMYFLMTPANFQNQSCPTPYTPTLRAMNCGLML